MKRIFLNLSNHPSAGWEASQLDAARACGDIVDWPFPMVSPICDDSEVEALALDFFDRIKQLSAGGATLTVHLMGEMTFCHALANLLQAAGIGVVASTTVREVTVDPATGLRTSRFGFVRFRLYPSIGRRLQD